MLIFGPVPSYDNILGSKWPVSIVKPVLTMTGFSKCESPFSVIEPVLTKDNYTCPIWAKPDIR